MSACGIQKLFSITQYMRTKEPTCVLQKPSKGCFKDLI